jgi:hypothetical protein
MNEFKFLDDASLKIPSAKELQEADDGARIICLSCTKLFMSGAS